MTCAHSVFKRSDLDRQVPEGRAVSEKRKIVENTMKVKIAM